MALEAVAVAEAAVVASEAVEEASDQDHKEEQIKLEKEDHMVATEREATVVREDHTVAIEKADMAVREDHMAATEKVATAVKEDPMEVIEKAATVVVEDTKAVTEIKDKTPMIDHQEETIMEVREIDTETDLVQDKEVISLVNKEEKEVSKAREEVASVVVPEVVAEETSEVTEVVQDNNIEYFHN